MNDSGITPEAKALIDTIITKQEGGWVLTQNANDPDGGWTYAGMTAKELGKICYEAGSQKYPSPYPLDAFKKDLETKPDLVHDCIYNLYYREYYIPLHLAELPASIRGPLFSAAVNCGVEMAVSLLQVTLNRFPYSFKPDQVLKVDGNLGPVTLDAARILNKYAGIGTEAFLREWMLHYINLVQKNAEAWEAAAKYLNWFITRRGEQQEVAVVPTVNRAASLEGWFNRVEFWR